MSEGQFIYKIYLDTKDAEAQQKAFESAMTSTGGIVGSIDGRIKSYERSIELLNKAIASGTGNQNAYQRELMQTQASLDRLRGTATAVAPAVAQVGSSSFNAGRAVMELSRGVEDLQYGFKGVVNNIPSLVMGLGASAGVAGAISLVAVAVNQLIEHFGKVDPAVKEASTKAKEHLEELEGRVKSLGLELRKIRIGASEAETEQSSSDLTTAAKKRIDAFAKMGSDFLRVEQDVKARIRAGQTDALTPQAAEAMAAQKEYELALETLQLRLKIVEAKEEDKALTADIAASLAEAEDDAARKDKKKKDAEKAAKEWARNWIEAKNLELRTRQSDEAFNEKLDPEVIAETKRRQAIADIATAAAEEEAWRREQDWDQQNEAFENQLKYEQQLIESTATTAASIVAGASEQLLSDLISGQEHALDKFGISIMAQAGQSLVASGIKLIGEGTVSMLTPGLQGLGTGQLTAGAGLIVAGVGLGGVAGGFSANLAAQESGDKKASKDTGLSRGRTSAGSGGGSGGPASINITYGVSGPLPEDTAREIQKALRTNSRRGGR